MRHSPALRSLLFISALVMALVGCDSADTEKKVSDDRGLSVNGLKTARAFEKITNDQQRASAIFGEMTKVFYHPRCANCHTGTNGPTQGDEMHPHNPPVIRGAGMGADAMSCDACHGTGNVAFATMNGSIPGGEPWMLAPASMGWQDKTAAELCAQIKDAESNGGSRVEDLIDHLGQDHLPGWAWAPGEGRTPAPGNQTTFGALTAAWVAAGAHCPVE